MIQLLGQVRLRPIEWLGLGLVALLVFIWPIPGTIALRNVLLVLAVVVWLVQWHCSGDPRPRLPWLKAPLLWYGALTAWLVISAFMVSVDTAWSLLELKSQWLRSAVAGLLGFLLASWAIRPHFDADRARICIMALAMPITLQVVLTLGDTVWLWINQGYMPERIARLTGGKLGMSVNVNILLSLVIADALLRLKGDGRLVPLPKQAMVLIGIAGAACTYVIGARNGTFCLTALVLVALAVYLRGRPGARRDLGGIVVVLIVLAGASYLSFKSDYRWLMFEESAELAWDTETHRAWLDPRQFPLPHLQNGKKVEVSTYLRIAWLKEGAKVLLERPLGVGYGRNAMGRAFYEKYGHGPGGHADNGFIDFSLAAGLPGTFLGAALLLSLMLVGWHAYTRGGSAIGLVTFLLVLGYAMRTLLDSMTRDNYLEQFLFMASMLATMSVADGAAARGSHEVG